MQTSPSREGGTPTRSLSEELLDKVLPIDLQAGSNLVHYAAQSAHPEGAMLGNGNVMLGTHVGRGQPQVVSRLAGNPVSVSCQKIYQILWAPSCSDSLVLDHVETSYGWLLISLEMALDGILYRRLQPPPPVHRPR